MFIKKMQNKSRNIKKREALLTFSLISNMCVFSSFQNFFVLPRKDNERVKITPPFS